MQKLKPSFVQLIKEALESSTFTLADFEINHPKRGISLVDIKFSYVPEYYISIHETTKKTEETTSNSGIPIVYGKQKITKYLEEKIIEIVMSPGEYKSVDKIEVYEIGDLIENIPTWCNYIKKDLQSVAPQVDPIEELRKKFSDEVENLYDDPEAFFLEDEASDLDNRFEVLYKKIEELQEEYSITQSQLKAVQLEFTEFKNSARIYPKGMWAKITNNKLISTMSNLLNTKEGRELIVEQIKRLMQE